MPPPVQTQRERFLRDVPRSGDALVDWILKQFVFFLRKETVRLKRKKRLIDKDIDPHRRALMGLISFDAGPSGEGIEITINSAKSMHCNRDEEVETLIHELCHIVFWKTWEHFIDQIERILIKRLTVEQKTYLKSFLPRHEVKS